MTDTLSSEVVTVNLDPAAQVTGTPMLTPGSTATAVPAVAEPVNGEGEATLVPGQWMMDPMGEYVLVLGGTEPATGLCLYQVIGANQPPGPFNAILRWTSGPGPAQGGQTFFAQTDGRAVLYGGDGEVLWSAGGDGPAQYFLVQTDGTIGLGQIGFGWSAGVDSIASR